MAAYVIALVTEKDAGRMKEYAAGAGPTLAPAGGEVLIRAKVAETLAGSLSPDRCLIIKFESAAAARAWYQSPEYQRMIPIRDVAMKPDFLLIEE
jgi:uncharacterized protein (DUF1330 family)